MNAQVCRYCTESLNGLPQFHRGGNIFCNEEHATLYDYADFYILPPYKGQEVFPNPPPMKPFVGDSDHADIYTDRGGQRIVPDMGERKHE